MDSLAEGTAEYANWEQEIHKRIEYATLWKREPLTIAEHACYRSLCNCDREGIYSHLGGRCLKIIFRGLCAVSNKQVEWFSMSLVQELMHQ